ncbi:MAG: hypothetical protein ACPLKV_01765 [Minisyncoccia bacterium]
MLVFLGIILLVAVLFVSTQAQEKAKKDRWELEVDYGQFWVHKWNMPNDIVEKTYNPDIRLAFRLRIFKGFYVGVIGGVKKETQKEFWQETIWSNYFWLEDRFGDFLFKDVTRNDLTVLKTAPYIGAEVKLNLFTLKFSKKMGITPFGMVSVKKWAGKTDGGFIRIIDYTVLENGIPYLIFHGEFKFGQGTRTFWRVNPDGTKGSVYYSDKRSIEMTDLKAGTIFTFGGGLQFRAGNFSLPVSFQIEKRKDVIYFDDEELGTRTFSHFLVQMGVAYRF